MKNIAKIGILALISIILLVTVIANPTPSTSLDYHNQSVNGTKINISWTQSTLPGLQGYNIYRSNDSTTFAQIASGLPNTTTFYIDPSGTEYLPSGQYYYFVEAYNATNSTNSTTQSILIQGTFAENIFLDVQATATSNGTITVTWDMMNDYANRINFIDNITIYRTNGATITPITITDPTTTLTNNNFTGAWNDTNLAEGLTLTYNVSLNLINGQSINSGQSNEVLSIWNPRIDNKSINFTRSADPEYVTLYIEGTYAGENIRLKTNYSYTGFPNTANPSDVPCQKITSNTFSCQVELLDQHLIGFDILKGKVIEFTGYAYEFNNEQFRSEQFTISKVTPNAPPFATNVEITNSTSGGNPILTCNYEYNDKDGDTENTALRQFIWYIQNEGQNDFIEVLGENEQTIPHPIFDNNDIVICSVRVHDGEEPSAEFYNSSIFEYNRNMRPTLYFVNASATPTIPAVLGDFVDLTAKVLDEDATNGVITVNFYRDELNVETTYGGNDSIEIGLKNGNDSVLWIFSNTSGIPLQEIQIRVEEVFNNGDAANFSKPIWSLYGYEVDTYGEIPSNTLDYFFKDQANIMVANITNIFVLEDNPIVASNKFMTIKVCIDTNYDGLCDTGITNDSIVIKGNRDSIYQNNQSHLATSDDETNRSLADSKYFVSDNVRLIYNTLYNEDKLLCSGTGNFGDTNPTISCSFEITGNERGRQTFSAIAVDPQGFESRTRIGHYYVSQPPIISNIEILRQNGTLYTDNDGNLLSLSNFTSANGFAEANESLYCSFDTNDGYLTQYSSWANSEGTYLIQWYRKDAEGDFFEYIEDAGSYNLLPYAFTSTGNLWKCTVTPRDAFADGETVESDEVSIGINYSNRPIILSVNDNSNNITESIYVGNKVQVDISWIDPNSNNFRVYVCKGDENEAQFSQTGCLNYEYYRSPGSILRSPPGQVHTHTFGFEVPEDHINNIEYNYTVFICDTDGLCSIPQQNATGNFWVNRLRNISYVTLVNEIGEQYNTFVNITDNLFCNFSFYDYETELTYTQENATQLINDGIIEIHWYKDQSFTQFTRMFSNVTSLANTQTSHGDRWYCQLRFTTDNPQETNSEPVLVRDESMNVFGPPTIQSFFSLTSTASKINVGSPGEFKLVWNNPSGNPVYAYICDSNNTTATGCYDGTLTHSEFLNSNDDTLIYIPENRDNPISPIIGHAIICDTVTLQCSNVTNTTFYVNYMPTATNVTLLKNQAAGSSTFFCDYSFVSNEPGNFDDVNTSATHFRWFKVGNQPELLQQGFGEDTFYPGPGQHGFIYCEVRVVDNLGLTDSEYRRSAETLSISTNQYEIKYMPLPLVVNKSNVTLTGVLNTQNTDIYAYTFIESSVHPNKFSNAISEATINPVITTGKVGVYAESNTTSIAIQKPTNIPLAGYIKFQGHQKENFTYYEYVFDTESTQFVFINLSTPLKQAVAVEESIQIFTYEKPTGWFEIILPLEPNKYNSFELAAADGGFLINAPVIFSDLLPPNITIDTNGTNNSYIQEGGIIDILISDLYGLNLSTIQVNISKSGNHQRFIYNITENNLTETVNTLDLITGWNVSGDHKNTTHTLQLADNFAEGTYSISVFAKDLAGYAEFFSQNVILDKTTLELSNIKAYDPLTGNDEILRGDTVNFEWDVSIDNLVGKYFVNIYHKAGTTETLLKSINTTSKTYNYTIDLPINNTCYFIDITVKSHSGINSTRETSNCITYSSDEQPRLYIASENLFQGVLFINNNITFNVTTENVQTITYSVIDYSNNEIENGSAVIASANHIYNIEEFNLTYDFPAWNKTQYRLILTGIGLHNDNATEEYVIARDIIAPNYINSSGNSIFNNTDEIILNITATDNRQIKEVLLESTIPGNELLKPTNSAQVSFNNISYRTYYFKLNNSQIVSNTVYDFNFTLKDYAKNVNTTALYTLTTDNRAPINSTIIPTIYWNKSAANGILDLNSYFIDPDGDTITYSNQSPINGEIDIDPSGIMSGTFSTATVLEQNISIVLTDIHGASNTYNVTFILLEESCTSYKGTNRFFVGFSDGCNPDDPPPTTTPPTTTPPTTGGTTGGSSGTGGGSTISGGSIQRPAPTQPVGDVHKEIINNLQRNEQRIIRTRSDELYVTQISFRYLIPLQYGVIEIRNSGRPSGTTVPTKPAYGYFQINKTNIDNEQLSDVIIRFRVRKNNAIGINENNALLARWEGNEWVEYEGQFYTQDETYYHYLSRVPGLSYFVILKDQEEAPEPEEIPRVEEPREEIIPPRTEDPQDTTSFNILPWILILIAIALLFVGGYAITTLKVKPKEEPKKVEPPKPIIPQDYVKNQLAKGVIEEEIKAVLLKAGWSLYDIENEFKKYKKQKKVIEIKLVDPTVIKQIEYLEKHKFTKKEIEEELESRHIPSEVVSSNMYYYDTVRELQSKVAEWVRKGYTVNQIKKHLIELNWPTIFIYDILKRYK